MVSCHWFFGVLFQPGRQKMLSRCVTSIPKRSPSRRENVDFPAPAHPITAILRSLVAAAGRSTCETAESGMWRC
jgi:hypothetical protein